MRSTLDDRSPEVRPRFDSYCTYHRLSSFLIGSDLPDREDKVTIELLREAPDKAKTLAQRNQTIDDPKKFAAPLFRPGALLLVGESVP